MSCKSLFVKGYVPNWSEEVFVIKEFKNIVPWTYVIKGKEIVGTLYKKELQKANQKEFRVEKVIKRKGNKLYVKKKIAKKFDLANLKSNVDKLDTDKLKNCASGLRTLKSKIDKLNIVKLETTLADLIKLGDGVKNQVVTKIKYNDIERYIKEIEEKIPDITNLAAKLLLLMLK